MTDAGVEQNALGSGGFTSVDVGGDTDVAIALDRSFTCHMKSLMIMAISGWAV
ncbi:Uncharacterised protein [Yersinia enterocolitica]|nr:Uncharacterised protein [Yersinia enterocolitica]